MNLNSYDSWKVKGLITLLLLGLLSTGVHVGAGFAQDSGPIYIVQSGDTLTGIAFRFGTTVAELVEVNQLANPSSIIPGQELIIPGYEGVSGVLGTRTVLLGHTVEVASRWYGVPEDALVRLNRIVHPFRLYVGQPLIVPEQGGRTSPSIRTILSEPGQTPLMAAVIADLNPWILTTRGGTEPRLWLVPGEELVLPGESTPESLFPYPVEAMEVEPLPVVQGETAEIRIRLSEEVIVKGALGDWELAFNDLESFDQIALQGIHALAEPGLVDLTLVLTDPQSGLETFSLLQPLRIAAGGYGSEFLQVPPETLDPENTRPEDELIQSVVSQVTTDRLWEGPFQYPSDYYETFPSFFGTRRSYNGSPFSYYHTGLDLYGSTTTPIYAPARGRVAFTGTLTVRGNATYIDHGWGVYTGYLHQSQILVEAGQLVERGQIIGYAGGTGRVTGPHIHWEVWVGGVPVQPVEWTQRGIPGGG